MKRKALRWFSQETVFVHEERAIDTLPCGNQAAWFLWYLYLIYGFGTAECKGGLQPAGYTNTDIVWLQTDKRCATLMKTSHDMLSTSDKVLDPVMC